MIINQFSLNKSIHLDKRDETLDNLAEILKSYRIGESWLDISLLIFFSFRNLLWNLVNSKDYYKNDTKTIPWHKS